MAIQNESWNRSFRPSSWHHNPTTKSEFFLKKKPLLIDQMQILKHTKINGISFSYKKQEDSILLAESGVLLHSKRNRTQEATEPMI